MEKISRIVPTSPRLQAVDMAHERPVRQSAPGFGAPVSQSTNRGPQKHAVVEATRVYNETYGPDAKIAKETESVKRLADKFFLNQAQMPESVNQVPQSESVDTEIQTAPEESIEIPVINPEEEAAPKTSAPYSVRI